MLIAEHLPVAQTAAVVNRGVGLPVAQHIVPRSDKGAENAKVGLESGGKGYNTVLAQEIRQFLLEDLVQNQGAVEQTGAGAAGSVFRQGLLGGLDDLRHGGQAEIVVGAEHNPALSLHDDLCVLAGLKLAEVGEQLLLSQLVGGGVLAAFIENISHVQFSFTHKGYYTGFSDRLQGERERISDVACSVTIASRRFACSLSLPFFMISRLQHEWKNRAKKG